MVRGGTHAAPAGNVGFPLVSQGPPCKIAHAQLLGTAAEPLPRRGRIGDLLVFPMVPSRITYNMARDQTGGIIVSKSRDLLLMN